MKPNTAALKTELSDANTLLRTVIDENPNIIFMKDWDGKFLIGNHALADLYGTTTEDLVGKDDGAFNPNAEQVAFFLQNARDIMSQSETQVVLEESTHVVTGEVSYFQSIKKPIITAEKIPGLAVNSTTRVMVCQGVAPKAKEPTVKCFGTLKMASSAIEKIVGITAKPIATPTTKALRWS